MAHIKKKILEEITLKIMIIYNRVVGVGAVSPFPLQELSISHPFVSVDRTQVKDHPTGVLSLSTGSVRIIESASLPF